MPNARKNEGRVRPVLLVLLWIWAALVFVVVDLIFNVTEFDAIRPDIRIYRAMRCAAHEMVGEPYRDGDFGDYVPGRVHRRLPGAARNRMAELPEARRQQLFEELSRYARSSPTPPERVTAMRALAAAFGDEARPFLIDLVRDGSASQGSRAEAARLVGTTGTDALDSLGELLSTELPDRVRAGAVRGLVELGTAAAAQRAADLSAGAPSLVQAAAVRALERFERAECIAPLAAKANDTTATSEARVAACRGLGRTGAVDELERIVLGESESLPVRMAAIQALESSDEPDAVAVLRSAAGVASPEVARRADVARTRLATRRSN